MRSYNPKDIIELSGDEQYKALIDGLKAFYVINRAHTEMTTYLKSFFKKDLGKLMEKMNKSGEIFNKKVDARLPDEELHKQIDYSFELIDMLYDRFKEEEKQQLAKTNQYPIIFGDS